MPSLQNQRYARFTCTSAQNPHRDANQRERDDTRDRPRVRHLSAVYLRSASRGLYGLQAVPPRWLPTLPSPPCSPSPRPVAGSRDPATVSYTESLKS
jgi:hypothetical protein